MAAYEMDDLDRQLLNLLQSAFPLVDRPFAALADHLQVTEAEVLGRVQNLKEARIIRQMSAIFDSRGLGYKSSLAAAKFSDDALDDGALLVNQHPGVSHNYKRNHEYNLWFTVTVPPYVNLEQEVQRIGREAGAEDTLFLPTLKLFKIGVNFDMTGTADLAASDDGPVPGARVAEARELSDTEIAAVRVLQRDLPVESEPFKALAAEIGLSQDELLRLARSFQQEGQMRRFAAVIHHRRAGFSANAMGVWRCPEELLSEVGPIMASFRGVSHCYRRPSYGEKWPFNIFTMVHGQSREQCEEVLAAISEKTGIRDYGSLYSSKEYKKIRVRYFEDEAYFRSQSVSV